ncbi:MAG: toll/interleukin-1 receptor domain-containing protein [Bacteroidales bacterium]|nr:toll/interleukin-1 receptor domain-containing protein [Bacteroidales bacterium]
MSGKQYDVFISYRRSDGKHIARILTDNFEKRGYRPFLDFEELTDGRFDKRIENAILDAPVFVMVLTNDYFSRCNDENDWVRREIDCAIANEKVIIPVNYDGNLNGIPDYLEQDLKDEIGLHQFSNIDGGGNLKVTFDRMIDQRIRKVINTIDSQSGVARVNVLADADCDLIVGNKAVAVAKKGVAVYIRLPKGSHTITARSIERPNIQRNFGLNIDIVPGNYSLNIKIEKNIKTGGNNSLEEFEKRYNRLYSTGQYKEAFAECLKQAKATGDAGSVRAKAYNAVEKNLWEILVPTETTDITLEKILDLLAENGWTELSLKKDKLKTELNCIKIVKKDDKHILIDGFNNYNFLERLICAIGVLTILFAPIIYLVFIRPPEKERKKINGYIVDYLLDECER